MTQTRRLAAILAADVAGYSRLSDAEVKIVVGQLVGCLEGSNAPAPSSRQAMTFASRNSAKVTRS